MVKLYDILKWIYKINKDNKEIKFLPFHNIFHYTLDILKKYLTHKWNVIKPVTQLLVPTCLFKRYIETSWFRAKITRVSCWKFVDIIGFRENENEIAITQTFKLTNSIISYAKPWNILRKQKFIKRQIPVKHYMYKHSRN